MSNKYLTGVLSKKSTPQTEPIPGSNQVPNSAGGFAFPVSDWTRLQRFCILGSEGNTYYATEKALTLENAKAVERCILENGIQAVKEIISISVSGRAPKVSPCLFSLAMASSIGKIEGKRVALESLPLVARTGSHLFEFMGYVKTFRGEGRSLLRGLKNWYLSKAPDQVAFNAIKYQQRNGWSHRDILRLCHAKANEPMQSIFHWIVKGWESVGDTPHENKALVQIWAFEKAKRSTDKKEIISLIRDYNLPRECIPTQFLKEAEVWDALLDKMPMMAMVRNLATMTRVGLLTPMSKAVSTVCQRLGDAALLKKSRMHPVGILAAMMTYRAGRGQRGSNTWNPIPQIVDALDRSFYQSFGNVPSTGKRWLLALDVSGSMDGGEIAGVPGLTPRIGSAAMALVTAATEPQHGFVAFTSSGWGVRAGQYSGMGLNNGITPLSISPRQRLDDVCNQIRALPMGGTDCALPMIYATENKLLVDAFVVLTDSETWAGGIHPTQALKEYRNKMGIPAKLIVVGMVSSGFSIADPNDAGMLDCVGLDANTPALMADFVTGGSTEKDHDQDLEFGTDSSEP